MSDRMPPRRPDRLAVVYIRQSTEQKAGAHEGSRLHQERQREHAVSNRWREQDIEVIACDLGCSGIDLNRKGYQRLVEMIAADAVGAVFVSDISRVCRDDEGWLAFLKLLAEHDVLLFGNGILVRT